MKTLALVIVLTIRTVTAIAQVADYPYRPAMYSAVAGVSQELKVFPLVGNAISVPVSFALGTFAYSPDGKALFGVDGRRPKLRHPGLFKIELNRNRVSQVPGSIGLAFDSLAVSANEDRVVFAGVGPGVPCGIFELSVESGDVRKIADDTPCTPLDPSTHRWGLSLSADGKRATALRNHHLQLIDLATGIIKPFGEEIELGSWSPDGRWLAVLDLSSAQTVLLDARTLERRKLLGNAGLTWSPDSRYLLGRKREILCGLGSVGTLETLDIETGKRTEISSSRCQIDRESIGWVTNELTQHR